MELRKRVMEKNDDTEDDLATVWRNIEIAAGEVAHHTKAEREKHFMCTPENVRLCEEAAARCTAKIKRRVQESQGGAPGEMEPGRRQKKKPLRTVCERTLH